MAEGRIRSFEAIGIELEYMIVDLETLAARPCSDVALRDAAGAIVSEVDDGAIAWSNELAAHVIELKTSAPARTIDGLADAFHRSLQKIDARLEAAGAGLLPSAMHPLMDAARETKLWAHESSEVYEAYDRIFDCRGHGWTNLQSMHINLPFAGDEEFGRLHAAVRAILPILPGLAASSPFEEGKLVGGMDRRLLHYQRNQAKVPSVAGAVIPEPAWTRDDYERLIFAPMYRDISPFDPDRTLQHEWLNSRGAIARFDRNAIEIRVMDVQECPRADLALAKLVVACVERFALADWPLQARLRQFPTEALRSIFDGAVSKGSLYRIDDGDYLSLWQMDQPSATIRALLQKLISDAESARLRSRLGSFDGGDISCLRTIAERGTLAERMAASTTMTAARAEILDIMQRLRICLLHQRTFE